jgi:hypothetical protein
MDRWCMKEARPLSEWSIVTIGRKQAKINRCRLKEAQLPSEWSSEVTIGRKQSKIDQWHLKEARPLCDEHGHHLNEHGHHRNAICIFQDGSKPNTIWQFLFYRKKHEASRIMNENICHWSSKSCALSSAMVCIAPCNWEANKKNVAQLVETFVITSDWNILSMEQNLFSMVANSYSFEATFPILLKHAS